MPSRLDPMFHAAVNRQNFDREVHNRANAAFTPAKERAAITGAAETIRAVVGDYMSSQELAQARSLLLHAAAMARR